MMPLASIMPMQVPLVSYDEKSDDAPHVDYPDSSYWKTCEKRMQIVL